MPEKSNNCKLCPSTFHGTVLCCMWTVIGMFSFESKHTESHLSIKPGPTNEDSQVQDWYWATRFQLCSHSMERLPILSLGPLLLFLPIGSTFLKSFSLGSPVQRRFLVTYFPDDKLDLPAIYERLKQWTRQAFLNYSKSKSRTSG